MCICIPNMKFLRLTLWQGQVCTDDNTHTNDNANANDDRQSMIVQGSLVDKVNELKIMSRSAQPEKEANQRLRSVDHDF